MHRLSYFYFYFYFYPLPSTLYPTIATSPPHTTGYSLSIQPNN
jgi:hypothetical protein